MAQLLPQDVSDVVSSTLRELGPPRFQQIAQSLQFYSTLSMLLKKDKIAFDEGRGIQRSLMLKTGGSAKHVGLMDTDQPNIADVIANLTVDYVFAQADWSIIYETDILMNRGRSLIFNVIEPKRVGALIDLADELEDRIWDAPPASGTTTLPWGFQYWVVENASTGHNGGAPSGHTTVGGINPSTYPNFKNYTDTYTSISKGDLVKKMRKAERKCKFRSPVAVKDYRGGVQDRYRVMVNETTISGLEDLGEGQNENLGRDIASMDGMIMFHKYPVLYIPKLDERTDDPVYLLDFSTIYPACLKGAYLRESEAKQSPNSHRIWNVFLDLAYNLVCIDRRRQAVITTSV